MKLLDIINEIRLNEQASFSRFLTKTLPSLGKTFEHNFFTELRKILNKDLSTITPEELSAAYKLPQMSGFRKQIADKLMEDEFNVVDNILKKYDLTVPQQVIVAGRELAQTLDVDPAFLKDVKASYLRAKNAVGQTTSQTTQGTHLPPPPPQKPNTVQNTQIKYSNEQLFDNWRKVDPNFIVFENKLESTIKGYGFKLSPEQIDIIKLDYKDFSVMETGQMIDKIRELAVKKIKDPSKLRKVLGAVNKWYTNKDTSSNIYRGMKTTLAIGVAGGTVYLFCMIYSYLKHNFDIPDSILGISIGDNDKQDQQQQQPLVPGATQSKTNKGWLKNF